MGPILRIGARYGIGFLAAKGVIPDELGKMITDDTAAIDAIQFGLAGGLALVVEYIYTRAKLLGGKL